jgi:hypothetical protein
VATVFQTLKDILYLAGPHALTTLWHQFVLRNGVLRRMFDVLVHLSGGGKTQCRVEATVAAIGQLNGATM